MKGQGPHRTTFLQEARRFQLTWIGTIDELSSLDDDSESEIKFGTLNNSIFRLTRILSERTVLSNLLAV